MTPAEVNAAALEALRSRQEAECRTLAEALARAGLELIVPSGEGLAAAIADSADPHLVEDLCLALKVRSAVGRAGFVGALERVGTLG